MSLRFKITLALLVACILTAITIGWIARGVVERQFTQSLIDQAFVNYRQDVQNYAREYGSIEAALRSERFPEFVGRTRGDNGLAQPLNADRAPFP